MNFLTTEKCGVLCDEMKLYPATDEESDPPDAIEFDEYNFV